jgi:hypothetical protein
MKKDKCKPRSGAAFHLLSLLWDLLTCQAKRLLPKSARLLEKLHGYQK